ncbi:MAG: protein kinase [Elusimicrobia bacterium]|nr:protein kinase [Elusimicrobiota bacterium]
MKTFRQVALFCLLLAGFSLSAAAADFLLKEFTAHDQDIWTMAYSSSGNYLATGGKDTTIKLWQPSDYKLLKVLKGQHTQGVVAMAFSPSAKYLVSAGQDKIVEIWRMDIMAGAARIQDSEQVTYSLAFSPDGRYMAAGGLDGTLRIYRSVVFRLHKALPAEGGIFSIAFSEDGKYMASAHSGGVVQVWDAQKFTLIKTLKEHAGDVLSVAFSPDGKHLASAGKDRQVRVWSVPDLQLTNTLSGSSGAVLYARFSPDSKYLAAGGEDKNIRVWETQGFKYLLTLSGHKSSVDVIAFSPDGKTLVSASEDRTVRVWSTDWAGVAPSAAPAVQAAAAAPSAHPSKEVDASTAAPKGAGEQEAEEKYKQHFAEGAAMLGRGMLSEAEDEFRSAAGFKKTPEVAEKLIQLSERKAKAFRNRLMQGGGALLFLLLAGVYVFFRKRGKGASNKGGQADKIKEFCLAGKPEKAFKLYKKLIAGGAAPDILDPDELYGLFEKNSALDKLLDEKLTQAYLSVYVRKFAELKKYDPALKAYDKLKALKPENMEELLPQAELAALIVDSGKTDLLKKEGIPAPELVAVAFKLFEAGKDKEALKVLSFADALACDSLPIDAAAHLVDIHLGTKKDAELVKSLQDKKFPAQTYSFIAAGFGNKGAQEQVIAVLEAGIKHHGNGLRSADYQQLAAAYSAAGKIHEMKPELVPDEYKYHMVEALMEKGKNAEALKVLNLRSQDKWTDKDFHLCMQLYIRLDMYDLAEEMVTKLLASKPVGEAPEFYYDFATYCEKAEKLEKAAEIYKQFILSGVTFRDVVLRYPALRDKIARKDAPAPKAAEPEPKAEPKAEVKAEASPEPKPETAAKQPEAEKPAQEAPAPVQEEKPEPRKPEPKDEAPAAQKLLSPSAARQLSRLEDDSRRIAALKGGKMELEKEIGRGGMGIVYSVFDKTLNRRVAVKRMRDELYMSKKEVHKFLNEARTVAQLNHPNIVIVYEILEMEDMAYILFEYIDGTSLENMLAGTPKGMRFGEALRIIEQVCNGLSYAHSHNVIHRDLKPSNIMLANDGLVKITDFGIARVAKDTILRLTGASTGTLAYMSPEQELGQCDPAADIYSLGVMIYELLTGELPFKGPNFYLQKEKMVYRPILDLSPELPKKVDSVISKCLQADKSARYGSVDEVLRDVLNTLR